MMFRRKHEPKHKRGARTADEPVKARRLRRQHERRSVGYTDSPRHARWYHVVDLIDWVDDLTDWSR
jgi:hypothetical protein